MRRKYCILTVIVAAVLVLALTGWVIWSNLTVGLTTITVLEENLPHDFHGFRIAQVSDLHNSFLWKQTVAQLKKVDPDITVITGDLVDSYDPDIALAMEFIAQAVQIADCYYVSGNHEARLPQQTYRDMVSRMREMGVTVLENTEVHVCRNDERILIAGHSWSESDRIENIGASEDYRILLSHQPDRFDAYAQAGYDLIFTGHAHGGQFRLPLLGGIFSPGQGLLPKYDSGMYTDGVADMIVSRGIGNSLFPIRLNNRPEVVLVILEQGER